MSNRYRRTATIVWALLCLLSLSSVQVSGGLSPNAAAAAGAFASSMVLVIAFVKVRMVVLHFMEVSNGPLGLRLAFEGWIVGALVLLVVLVHLNAVEAFLFNHPS
jgi:Prokaryotic Cytochrome C oxidase subunit IV